MATSIRPGARCLCRLLRQESTEISSKRLSSSFLNNISVEQEAKPWWFGRSASTAPQMEMSLEESQRLLERLTVKVKSSDEAVLESYLQFMKRAGHVLNLDISGKIVLPMHKEKRTLLKSPHINKKHRVQFELRTHGRMIQVRHVTGDTADIYLEYIQRNIPEGVSMSVEATELETLPLFLQNPMSEI